MKLKVKDMDIATGGVHVAILNQQDAQELDLHHMDRLQVRKGRKKTIAVLDIAESKKAVPPGRIGLFEEALDALSAKSGDTATIELAPKPKSVTAIKRKLDGKTLTRKDLHLIIADIVHDRLTDVELTSFVTAVYAHGMSMHEVADLTKEMVETGETLNFKTTPICDLHSIGGVPGNRTTMLIVPILVAAGCTIPKTSSRAITSPAGTADTMEVFCSVSHTPKKLKKIIRDVGGFIIWGGAVNLAPADDKIIRVEHPLNIDAEGQMLASIMSKKASVGATHLLIEIPYGAGTKVDSKREAQHLKRHFDTLGKLLKINVKVLTINGSQPVGNGIGPVLEARDVIWALRGDKNAPQDLIKKSVSMAGQLLEFVGKAKKGNGKTMAKELLVSGAAYQAMNKIAKAQGGKLPPPNTLKPAARKHIHRARKTGTLSCIDNITIAKAARLAGAPIDKGAGLYIHQHCNAKVKKGEPIITVYARNAQKLAYAKKTLHDAITIT